MPNEKLEAAIGKILRANADLDKKEPLLVLTDKDMGGLGFVFFKKALELGAAASVCDIQPLGSDGEEPPAHVISSFKKAKVIVLLTSKSLAGTTALSDAAAAGAKVIDLAGITGEKIIEIGDSIG